jgi:hypothetical protein
LVSVDKLAPQQGATDLVVSSMRLFTDFLALHALVVDWQVRDSGKVSRNRALLARVLRELGLKLAAPMVWGDGERECWPNADDPDLHRAATRLRHRAVAEWRRSRRHPRQ